MTENQGTERISRDRLVDFAARALEAAGMPRQDAAAGAPLVVEPDLNGADGHGIFRLPQYVRRIRAGGINTQPQIRVIREKAAMALVDGDNALGHLVVHRAAEAAIEKASEHGVGWAGVRNGNHAGAASTWARIPLEQGMIGLYLAVGSANHLPPWGGVDMLLSTNPLAVAIPALEEPPVILDMATTVAAYGKVKTALQRGEMMPEGWMIDREGKPLTDPRRAGEGFLLPIGGYKGYGLALIIGLLAGTLNGAAMGRDVIDFNADDVTATNTGQAVLAISPEAFGDAHGFRQQVDEVVRTMRGSARMPGVDRIRLPGEMSHAKRLDRLENGVPIPAPLLETLNVLAGELGIDGPA
ncbi:MAG: Ldh family oxidoreductase [Rhodospirillales bacterium]|nr:MAG: Ldh family oxidoreductase [Rhodospirillales bacterium]